MASYRVLAVFELGHGPVPVGPDVLSPYWGGGLDFGYCDGVTLTVSAVSSAVSADAAAADVVARCIGAWSVAASGQGVIGEAAGGRTRARPVLDGPRVPGQAGLRPASVRVLPHVQPEVSA